MYIFYSPTILKKYILSLNDIHENAHFETQVRFAACLGFIDPFCSILLLSFFRYVVLLGLVVVRVVCKIRLGVLGQAGIWEEVVSDGTASTLMGFELVVAGGPCIYIYISF